MNFQPYSKEELYTILNEPREVSDRPYMLHAAFILSCLFESLEFDEDEDPPGREEMFGMKIPVKVCDSIIRNANAQFIEAAREHTQIDIWDKPYSIRKQNAFDPARLHLVCKFEQSGEEYIISKDGIMNLYGESFLAANAEVTEEFKDCRSYLRKVIMVAEDDAHDGWNKLTDMEVTMYLWALFYRKFEEENEVHFREEYKDDLYTTPEDDRSCWDAIAVLGRKPHGLYTFSAKRVRQWNAEHHQKSVIDETNELQAEDYWYTKASRNAFK